MIEQSEDFRAAASLGRLAFLDLGSANATIEVYGTVRPVGGGDPGGDPLVVVVLAKPCGAVVAGSLVLEANDPEGELILTGGDAVWGRFVNGDSDWAFDADVTVDGGGGEIQFPEIHLFPGGRAPLNPSAIG